MAFNLGVNVVEVDGRAAPTVVAAPTSVAGFLINSRRGVLNQPVHVGSFADFVNYFGGYTNDAYGAYAVRGFFENGGTDAYVVRIARGDSKAANVTIKDRSSTTTPVDTLLIEAGVRGRPDRGAWGNALSVAVADHPRGASFIAAQIISANAEPFNFAGGDLTLDVTVNGKPISPPIKFTAADFANPSSASATEVARAINRQTAALQAAVTPTQKIVLASTYPGVASRLLINNPTSAASAAGPLGFTGGNANSDGALSAGTTLAVVRSMGGFLPGSAVRFQTRGYVASTDAVAGTVTIADNSKFKVAVDGGSAAIISLGAADSGTVADIANAVRRQANGFSVEVTLDNRLMLISNKYGRGSSIALSAPDAGATDARPLLKLSTAAPVAGAQEYKLLDIVSDRFKFISWTGGLTTATTAGVARLQSVEFDLIVYRGGAEVERFESLSMQDTLDYYVGAVINDPDRGSGYITVTDKNSSSDAGVDAPAERRDPTSNQLLPYPLADGSDGTGLPTESDYIGDPASRTGLYAYDPVGIQLLACPESSSPGLVGAALAYCESRGDVMYVGSPPSGLDLEGIKSFAGAFRGRNVYGALYAPWIQVVNPVDTTGLTPSRLVPCVGHVLGVYARTDTTRGVWKAPAGDEAQLRNALSVEFDITDVDLTDLVKNGSVNGVRSVPGSGIIIDSSRTLSTDTRWLYVPVRRLFNYVKTSLRDGLRWVAQEPHSEELRRMVKFNVVTPFLLGLWRRGAFGSDPADKVFTVVCGPENNPPSEVNLGNFNIEVYFYPVKPAETIIIVVGQQESGASTSER